MAPSTESDLPKIPAPAVRALDNAGIKKLTQLAKRTEKEVAELHGMGPKAVGILRDTLKVHGLSFKQPKPPKR